MVKRFALPLIYILIECTGCLNMDCDKTVVKRSVAPNGKLQAVMLLIDCGATTTSVSSIRMIESRDTTDIGSPENTIVTEAAGADFYWHGNDSLMIKGVDRDTVGGTTRKDVFNLSKTNGKVIILYSKD